MGHSVTLQPVITEKAMRQTAQSQYTFLVPKHATKLTIQQAVADGYDVHVLAVNIIKTPPKRKLRGGIRPGRVKAVVTLKAGESIKGFELPLEPEAQPSPEATAGKLSGGASASQDKKSRAAKKAS